MYINVPQLFLKTLVNLLYNSSLDVFDGKIFFHHYCPNYLVTSVITFAPVVISSKDKVRQKYAFALLQMPKKYLPEVMCMFWNDQTNCVEVWENICRGVNV